MKRPLRILYADDFPLSCELVREALEKKHNGFELIEAVSRADFECALSLGGINLVISDTNILGFEGLQVLDMVRAQYPRLPVIILTGTGSEEIAVEAFKRGAADYVIKTPAHIQHLPHTIYTVLEKKQLEDRRLQAEAELRASERKYNTLFSEMQSGSALHELIYDDAGVPVDYVTLEVNKAYETHLHVERSTVVGHKASETLPTEELTKWLGIFAPVAMGGISTHYEMYSPLNDKYFEGTAYCPEENKFAVTFMDVSDRKRVEKKLFESETRFRALFKNAGYAIGMAKAGIQVMVNQAYLNLFGYENDSDVIGTALFNDIASEERPKLKEYAQLRSRGEPTPALYETRGIRRDGTLFDMDVRVTTYEFQGEIYTVGILRDITEHKQAIDALRHSEQTAQRTLEQLRIVNQIGVKITAGLDFEQLMQTIYDQCRQIGAVDTFYIALYDEVTGSLSFPFYYKDGKRKPVSDRNIQESPGLVGYIIEHRQTLYLPDLSNLPDGVTQLRQPGAPTQSFVGVPLILNDRIVGALSMQSHALDGYSPEQIHTVELIATQVAIAIQNSQLYAQIHDERNLANALIDNLPGGFGMVNEEGRLVRWNKYVETMLGYASEEIQHLDILSIFPEEEQGRLTDLLGQVFAGGTMATDTLLISKQGGKEIPLFATGTRVEIGNEAYLLLIGIDITGRKRAEELLRESEDKFKYMFDHSIIGKSITLPAGEVNLNQAFCEMLGYGLEELNNKKWQEITHPDDIEPTQKALDALLSGERESLRFVKRYIHKNGSIVWADVATSLRRDKVGKPLYFMTTMMDITERKRVEEEIHKLNTELEKRVDERTFELREAQEKLVRHERLAVLGQLAGGVGHELRNPLGIIDNAVYYLRLIQPNADDKTKEYFGIIENETHTAEKIINDLLDFSRIKSIDSEKEAVDELFQRVMERYPAPTRVTVSVKTASLLPTVYVDPHQAVQILGNLVINAYQAMPDGGELTLSAQVKGKMVEISVQDTGMGILPEHMDNLFEPLFTTKMHGIGLGLAVSKKLVEANHGWIEVNSTPGQGTVFCVYLPIYKEEYGLVA